MAFANRFYWLLSTSYQVLRQDLMFSLQSDDGEVACVAISGRLRLEDVFQDGDALENVLGSGLYGRQILLDLSELQLIDSSGFCWLVKRQKRMFQQGGQLILHSAPPWLGQTLGRLKMDLIFCIAGDRDSAIRLARNHGWDASL
jgi:anti-anti-sigma factor